MGTGSTGRETASRAPLQQPGPMPYSSSKRQRWASAMSIEHLSHGSSRTLDMPEGCREARRRHHLGRPR